LGKSRSAEREAKMRKLLRKPSPAMIVACLALFVASAGTSIAASHYIITSTKQIKPSVLVKLRGAKGPRGARGPQGPAGIDGIDGVNGVNGVNGAQGPPGITSVSEVNGASLILTPGTYGAAPTAYCPAGSIVVGTGWFGPENAVGGFVESYHYFVGGFFGNDSSITITAYVQAICAQLSGSTSTSTASIAKEKGLYQAELSRARAIFENR
jgi:hypothetical protein